MTSKDRATRQLTHRRVFPLTGPWLLAIIVGLLWSGVVPPSAVWMSVAFGLSLFAVVVRTIPEMFRRE